jgi:outer membrane receptor protein involved in Fe transport
MKFMRLATGCLWLAVIAGGTAGAAEIEEIIVMATKRAESVQDIPIAVSAFTGVELEKAGVNDMRGIMSLSSSFFLTTTGSETGGTTARIRGVGTQGNNPGLESAVGMYVDGVYRNRSTVGYSDLGPVERIEVLRGPQGTLFGKNTSVGVVNVITERPNTEEIDGYLRVTGGDYSLFKGEAGIGGPIAGDWAAGIDALYLQRDGFYDDELTGEDFNTRDRYLARGQLTYEGDILSMRFIAENASRDERCCGGLYIVKGARTDPAIENLDPVAEVLTSDASNPFGRTTYTTPGVDMTESSDETGFSGEIVWDTGGFELTSITAWRNWESEAGGDLDYSGGDILYRDPADLFQEFETITQELRIAGDTERMSWLVGLYYIDEDLDTTLSNKAGAQYSDFTRQVLGVLADASLGLPFGTAVNLLPPFSAIGAGTQPGDGASDVWGTQSQSFAVFTRETFSFTDNLKLTVGLRYTNEDKDFAGSVSTTGTSCAGMMALAGFDPNNPSGPITPIIGGSQGLTNGALGLQCLGGTLNSTLDGNYSDSRSEDRLSGTVNLSYFFSGDVMGYLSYANGYKSGGYNLDRSGLDPDTVLDGPPGTATNFGIRRDVNALEFEEELVDSYEIGMKSVLGDGRVILNAAAYWQDFENFQLNTFNGLTFFVVTLDDMTSKGVEIDVQNSWTDNFYTSLGVSYNDAKYADDVQRSDGQPAGALAGAQLTHAPEWSAIGTLNWEMPLEFWSGWGAFAYLDARWTDGHNTGSDLDPEKYQSAYTVVNGRIGLLSDDDRWSIELWAHNLLDEEYMQVAFDSPIQNSEGVQPLESYSAFLGDPRTWGLVLGYRF